MAEVAGVTFSDSDSAPVPKFLNPEPGPGPEIFEILRIRLLFRLLLPSIQRAISLCFYLSNDHGDSCYCRN